MKSLLNMTETTKNNMPDDYMGLLRENEQLDKEIKKIKSESVISSEIAQALARGYTDLYYINIDTDELIEYYTDDDFDVLTEARRSSDFLRAADGM